MITIPSKHTYSTFVWVYYHNTLSKTCIITYGDVFHIQTMEPVDKLLQIVDPAKDREMWVKEHKTSEVRPVNMEL